jgi:hypothetical protein
MAEKTIKLLQFWYMAEVPIPGGETAMVEKIASRGDTVDITDDYDLQRGEEQDAFMSDEEVQAFEQEGGPYDVATAEEMKAATPPAADEFDWEEANPEDMADYMEENNMTVNQVLEVAHEHPDRLDEILEAENIVTGDSPRKGVTEGVAKIASDSAE